MKKIIESINNFMDENFNPFPSPTVIMLCFPIAAIILYFLYTGPFKKAGEELRKKHNTELHQVYTNWSKIHTNSITFEEWENLRNYNLLPK